MGGDAQKGLVAQLARGGRLYVGLVDVAGACEGATQNRSPEAGSKSEQVREVSGRYHLESREIVVVSQSRILPS